MYLDDVAPVVLGCNYKAHTPTYKFNTFATYFRFGDPIFRSGFGLDVGLVILALIWLVWSGVYLKASCRFTPKTYPSTDSYLKCRRSAVWEIRIWSQEKFSGQHNSSILSSHIRIYVGVLHCCFQNGIFLDLYFIKKKKQKKNLHKTSPVIRHIALPDDEFTARVQEYQSRVSWHVMTA